MNRTLCIAGTLAISLTWTASALALDVSTSPGTHAVFVSATHLSLPSGGGQKELLTAQITRGKRHTVIAFEAMAGLFGDPSVPLHVEINPDVNGVVATDCVPMAGECPLGINTAGRMTCPPMGTMDFLSCNAVGTWWIDVDAAESAHPGMFVGKPLNITLNGVESTGAGASDFKATLTARIQKK